tara:strand:- start:2509 stop:3183 length:675 start_codon:yes stop_codon:yes gene_type:complete
MKIEKMIIALLIILVGVNFYSSLQERERLNVGLNLLDQRISQAEENINKANEYIGNTLTDFDNMEYILREDIDFVSSELERHKHEKIYIERKEEPKPIEETEVPAVENTPEPTNIDESPSIERFYNPETEMFDIPNIETMPVSPVIVSCPRANNRLNKYISKLNIRRDYKFLVTYDIINDTITNVRFNNKVPSNLQGAVTKFINSFTRYGDVKDCQISIKVLEN